MLYMHIYCPKSTSAVCTTTPSPAHMSTRLKIYHSQKKNHLEVVELTCSMSIDQKKKNCRSVVGLFGASDTAQHAIITLSLLLFLSPAIPTVGAQNGWNGQGTGTEQNPYARFSPSMAIIIVVLIAALFLMGFFSIYIRHCSQNAGGSIRPVLSLRRRAAAARGLDPAVIENFPTFAYSTVKGLKIGKGALECAVCLNEFEDEETLRLIPKCDHVFHPECIDAWLESHVTCPVCRANLVPQPGESVHLPDGLHPELDDESRTTELENAQNGEVSIQVDEDCEVNNVQEAPALANRNLSFNLNRPPRSRSVRPRLFGKFRSHSTGHSLVQPGENVDRFTLRLPEEVRKQVMSRASLNRTASCMVGLPREPSSRRGYRTGEGSSRGRPYRRIEPLDRLGKSDRWVFSMAPPFFSRASSLRSPKVVAAEREGSTSSTPPRGLNTAGKMPCVEPKGDEPSPISAESARPPV